MPIPYDKTSSYHKGADRGPRAILDASTQVELYDIETDYEVYLRGIATLSPVFCEEGPEVLYQKLLTISRFLFQEQKVLVSLGGDHSITPGLVAGAREIYSDLTVLQIDAHGDTRDSYLGSRYNHACVMARVRELCPIAQVGIRAIDSSEAKTLDRSRVFFAHQILAAGNEMSWIENVSKKLNKHVYVTIDLDCFDSSIMPSTGTPEPGGLNWFHVVSLLRRVAAEHQIVGFDVVELLPRPTNPAPDFLAAKLIYQFLSYIFMGRK